MRKILFVAVALFCIARQAEAGWRVTWTDADIEESFDIERKAGTGTYAKVGSTAKDILTYTDTTAQLGVQYFYRIVAVNPFGRTTGPEASAIAKVPTAPGVPTLFWVP